MTVRTTAAAKPKRAQRKLLDPEVASPEHDVVLTWLLEHLDEVCEDLVGMDGRSMEPLVSSARADAFERWRRWIGWLDRHAQPGSRLDGTGHNATLHVITSGASEESIAASLDITDDLRRLMRKTSKEIAQWLREGALADPAPELGKIAVIRHEVMHRVDVGDGHGRKSTDVTFVDLAVVVKRPSWFELSDDLPSSPDADPLDDFYDKSQVRATLQNVSADRVRWFRHTTDVKLWFWVRAASFTLGEILQELKTLKALEHGDQLVALCVDHLDQPMRQHIAHEGFFVVCKADY